MYFKRIDMQGFKSFADPVSIDFHEGITCIVGPNGSGKSNIADALRWVLGEQSPKTLRGGKMEEVIFAGTASRKSRGMAEVTLVIDNSTGILPIDYGEVAITRRMYRSGDSEYAINRVPCRLRDIRELIMDTGIGVDGYSIIGQGRIADILSGKPESRREIFEEAAGIVKYRSKKAESEKKLLASRGNLDRVEDIISEIESRIGGLKADSEKATEYLALRDRYKDIEINITLKNIESIELKNEYIKDDLAETEELINGQKTEKEALEEEFAGSRARNQELDRLSGETRDKLLQQVEAINELSGRGQLQEERLVTIDRDLARLAEETESFAAKLEGEQANRQEVQETRRQLEERLAGVAADLEEKNRKVAEAARAMEKAGGAADSYREQIYEHHSAIAAKRSEINSLNNLKETLARRKEQLLSERGESQKEGQSAGLEHEEAVKNRDVLKKDLEAIEVEGLEIKSIYSEDVTAEKVLTQKLEDLRVAMGQAAARRKLIEEMEQSYEGYNYGVKFIMQLGLPGISGVVADLIQVPPGYETAVETALGAAMQNVVCRDDSVAQKAIGELKAKGAGRLTFLPIASIRSRTANRDRSLQKEAGFKGFAVEIVKYDSAYESVMEYLLGRVIIVDKLADAVRLSKSNREGFRYVTLDGEIINASGAITGGASRHKTAGLLERKAESQRLEEEIRRLDRELEASGKEREALSRAIADAAARMTELDKAYREKEMALLNAENDIARLENRLSEMENSQIRWQRELAEIDDEEARALSMVEALQSEVAERESLMAQAETLTESSMADHEAARIQAEAAGEELTQARLAAAGAESDRDNLEGTIARLDAVIKEIQESIDFRHRESENLRKQKEEIRQGSGDLAGKLADLEKEKLMTESILRQISEEKDRLTITLNEIEDRKNSLGEILLGYQTTKHELELKLAKNETQVESYKEKLWDDFEISYIQAIEFRKSEFAMGAAQREGREIRARIKELGEVNVGAIKEYESVSERYEFLTSQREDILAAMSSLEQIIDDMDKNIRRSFKESFDLIVTNFESTFQALFGGGRAELRLEDESRPLECGIEIVAQPPGKKLQNLNLLSGGEKTMTAIALMFAILQVRPTPFCILDEVEAALDDANIHRFAGYLKTFSGLQFALVTHQKVTMEHADVLYGVTMPEQGISKVISLRVGDDFDIE